MPQQSILLQTGMGGVAESYASVQDLLNLSLPRAGQPAYIDGTKQPAPYTVNGLTLKVTVVTDGIQGNLYTQTFAANYSTLDGLVAAVSIPGLIAINNGGLLRLQTQRVGYQQGLIISFTGTANSKIGFNSIVTVEQDQYNYGRSSITTDMTEDEMVYALVSATSTANSYLQRRFKLPLSSWDFGLTKAVCDIAAYTLMFRRGFSPQNTKNYDVNFKDNYEKAIKWLEETGNRMNHPVIVGAVKPNPSAAIPFLDDIQRWRTVVGIV